MVLNQWLEYNRVHIGQKVEESRAQCIYWGSSIILFRYVSPSQPSPLLTPFSPTLQASCCCSPALHQDSQVLFSVLIYHSQALFLLSLFSGCCLSILGAFSSTPVCRSRAAAWRSSALVRLGTAALPSWPRTAKETHSRTWSCQIQRIACAVPL